MSVEGVAKRFYERSHELNLRAARPQEHSSDQGLQILKSESHRYHCVYRELSREPGRKVCELGFGGPSLVPALASLSGSYTIVDVVDRYGDSPKPANVAFALSDLNNDFPFEDGHFDVVVAMMVIEHLFDPFHSFQEIARICKPSTGKVLINLPNIASLKCRWSLLLGRMPVTSSCDWFEKREWDGNHLHYFTISDTLKLAELVGLKVEAIHPVGAALALKRLRPSLFCHEVSFSFSRHQSGAR